MANLTKGLVIFELSAEHVFEWNVTLVGAHSETERRVDGVVLPQDQQQSRNESNTWTNSSYRSGSNDQGEQQHQGGYSGRGRGGFRGRGPPRGGHRGEGRGEGRGPSSNYYNSNSRCVLLSFSVGTDLKSVRRVMQDVWPGYPIFGYLLPSRNEPKAIQVRLSTSPTIASEGYAPNWILHISSQVSHASTKLRLVLLVFNVGRTSSFTFSPGARPITSGSEIIELGWPQTFFYSRLQ